MNRYFKLLFVFVSFLAISCEKETTEGISTLTQFPVLTMKGGEYVTVAKGGAYTEPGVTAKEGESDLTVTEAGTVNTAVSGVYVKTYSAVNKDGYSATTKRFVIVYSTDVGAAANNLTGKYARNTNGVLAEWIKLAPGVYKVINPGGAPGATLTVIAFNPTGFVIDIPNQVSSDGSETSSDLEDYSQMPTTYKWKIVNPGYGPSVRTFTKQ
jgi:hypothetical protein